MWKNQGKPTQQYWPSDQTILDLGWLVGFEERLREDDQLVPEEDKQQWWQVCFVVEEQQDELVLR